MKTKVRLCQPLKSNGVRKVKADGEIVKNSLLAETDSWIKKSETPKVKIKITDIKGDFTEKEKNSLKKKGLKNPPKKHNFPVSIMKDDSVYFNDIYHGKLSKAESDLILANVVEFLAERAKRNETPVIDDPVPEIKLTGVILKNPKKSKGDKAKLMTDSSRKQKRSCGVYGCRQDIETLLAKKKKF